MKDTRKKARRTIYLSNQIYRASNTLTGEIIEGGATNLLQFISEWMTEDHPYPRPVIKLEPVPGRMKGIRLP